MSNRRMFSKKIINSAKFLKMPLSSQALYFHLGLNADDDGVVEAFTVLRLVGGSEDDFRILISKQFIIPLNEEQVCFVVDWLEHNMIRADRKVDSIYKQLLIQCIDNVKLIESKPRADRIVVDGNGTSQSQSKDGLRQDKTRQVKTRQDKLNSNANADIDCVINYFNEVNKTSNKGAKPIIQGLTEILKDHTVEDVKLVIDFMSDKKGWYAQNAQNTLSVISKHTKFYEKLERACIYKDKPQPQGSHVINKEDYSDEAFKKVFDKTPREINNRFMERYTKLLAEQNKENK